MAGLPNAASAASGVPDIISYQGRLTNSSGQLLGGSGTTYYFRFSIWDSPTVATGSKLWPSSNPGSSPLTVSDGVFNVNIGDTANGYPDALTYNFQDNSAVYLQIEVSADNQTFETLGPRQRITSSGGAINAQTLAGLTPGTGANNLLQLGSAGEISILGAINGITVASGVVESGTWNGGLIASAYGGTGIDTSALSGIPTIANGVWSVANAISAVQGGTGITSYATGDLVYASGTNTLSKLPIGGAGKILTSDGTTIHWADAPSTGTGSITVAVGNTGTDFNVSGSPVSSGGTVTINIPSASGTNRGLLTSADWSAFNAKQDALAFSGPLSDTNDTVSIANAVADGSTKGAAAFAVNDFDSVNGLISIDYANGQAADATHKGFLTAMDWNTFNNKQNAIATGTSAQYLRGDLTLATFPTNVSSFNDDAHYITLTSLSGTAPVMYDTSTGTISIAKATTNVDGYLSASDWNTFNGKQAAGNYITGLTGDGTASGAGVDTFTLANVNAEIGTFGDGTHVPAVTVNSKGLVTGVTSTAISFPVTSVNGSVGDVALTTTSIPQGTNLYYTDAHARAAFSATSPVAYDPSTGVISMAQATGSTNGYLSSTDWNTFNTKQAAITTGTTAQYLRGDLSLATFPTTVSTFTNDAGYTTLGSFSANAPLTYNSSTGKFSIAKATASADGYLASADWTTFNNKQTALSGTGIVVSTGGTISYIYGTSSQFVKADGSLDNNTYLTSATGVASFNGRVGTVTPQSGDYTSDQVTQGTTNLYFSNALAIASTLTGYASGAGTVSSSDSILSAIQKLNGNQGLYLPLAGGTMTGQINWASGQGAMTDILGAADQPLTLASLSPVGSTTSLAGNAINFTASNAFTGASGGAAGGAINFTTGTGSNISSNSSLGGNFTVLTGDDGFGSGSAAAGGSINLTTGTSNNAQASINLLSGLGFHLTEIPGITIKTSTETLGGNGGGSSAVSAQILLQTGNGAPNSSTLTNSTGGKSGNILLTGGNGGIESGNSTSASLAGGAGSILAFTAGNGGNTTGTGTGGTYTGGIGGGFTLAGGAGGTASGAAGTQNGGAGGVFTLTGGTGGSGIQTAGQGGSITLQGGLGGVATTATSSATAGLGGDINLIGGNAQSTSQSPRGGNVNITGGNTFNTSGASVGGQVNITGGVPNFGGVSGSINLATVAGTANSAISGSINLTTATPFGTANAGAINLTTGNGGSAGGNASPWNGGAFVFKTGSGASNTAASSTSGAGGAYGITLGAGGTASGATAATGGAGGNFTLTGASGGGATGTGTNIAGVGSSVTLTSGAGGAASGGTSNTGGAAGSITLQIGAAGTGATANGAGGFVNFSNSTQTMAAFASTGQLAWNTGLGAITQILGPTDQALTIKSGSPASGNAQSLFVTAGSATLANGAGGSVTVSSGAGIGGGPGTSNSGSTTITAASGSGSGSSAAGAVNITGAAINSASSGGAVNITTPNGASNGSQTIGAINITTGTGSASSGGLPSIPGGNIVITTGGSTTPSATYTGTAGTVGGSLTTILGSGSPGGNSGVQTTFTGGTGGAYGITLGAGGASAASVAATGGVGSAFTVSGGIGGAVTGAGTNIGGAGSSLTFTSGNGGNASGGSSNTGGNSGSLNFAIGTPGTGATAAGATGTFNFTGGGIKESVLGGTGSAGITPFTVDNTASGATYINNSFLSASNMTAGEVVTESMGKAASNYNLAYMGFRYAGSGLSSNALTWGLYSADQLMSLDGTGALSIKSTQGANATALNISTASSWTSGQGTGIDFRDSTGETGHIQDAYDGTYTDLNFGGLYNSATYNTTSNQMMTLQGSGNLGIGTTSPTGLFQVAQVTAGVGKISNAASGTTVTGVGTQFLNTFKVGDSITANGETHAITAIASNTSMTTAAWTAANTSVAYTLTGRTPFTVLGNGNIGIGTVSPSNVFTVQGDTSSTAVGPILVKGTGGSTLGVALTLDSTADGSGKAFSFLSTGSGAAPGAGRFAVYDSTDSRYVFMADASGQYIAGFFTATPLASAGQITSYPNSASTVGLAIVGAVSQSANYFNITSNGSAAGNIFNVLSNGDVGIGTSAPNAPLEVSGNTILTSTGSTDRMIYTNNTAGTIGMLAGATPSYAAANGAYFGMRGNTYSQVANQRGNLFFSAGNPSSPTITEGLIRFITGADATAMTITNAGRVGIGVTAPSSLLSVGSTSQFQVDTTGDVIASGVTASGAVTFSGITSGASCNSATQSVGYTSTGLLVCNSSVSDQRLKADITPLDTATGLAAIKELNPVSYYWKDTNLPGTGSTQEQFGFIAQDVQGVLPNLVTVNPATYLTPDVTYGLNYQGFTAVAVEAIKELDAKVEPLASLDPDQDGSFASLVDQYLGDAKNKITKLFAGEVDTQKLCVGQTCLTEAQVQQILQVIQNQNAGSGSSQNSSTTTPPVMTQDSGTTTPSDTVATSSDDTDTVASSPADVTADPSTNASSVPDTSTVTPSDSTASPAQ